MAIVRRVETRCEQTRQLFQIEFTQTGAATWDAARVFTPRGGGQGTAPRATGGRPRTPTEPPLAGSFTIGAAYPGCPYCQATGFFSCGTCGQLNCWNEQGPWTTCGLCGHTGQVTGPIDSLSPVTPPLGGPRALGDPGPRRGLPAGAGRPLLPPKG